LGRVAFAGIFVAFAPANFTQQGIAWGASQGIPLARVLVPLAGVISLLGGLSVILGYRVKIGAWLLVLFLVPVTGMMHNFWAVKDPMMAQFLWVLHGKLVQDRRRLPHRALRRGAVQP